MSLPEHVDTASTDEFDSDEFLKEFYKECGREVTLAYTTLNQMKNWAIVVTAAIAAAIASAIKASATGGSAAESADLVFAGSMLAFLFTLRFFVRAILCYVNLLRWNKLQSDIVRLKLGFDMENTKSKAGLQNDVRASIDTYFHKWLSPIDRWAQITSNLKLGFGLLLALPVALMLWSGVVSWESCYTRTGAIFVIGGTLIEVYEFLTTSFLDTPSARARKKDRHERFPSPSGSTATFAMWVVLLLITAIYAMYCSNAICFCKVG